MDIRKLSVREQVWLAMQRVYGNALTTTSGGNISAIDERGHIFITPSGKDKGTLSPQDIVEVLPDGTRIGAYAPSMELPFHSNIYRSCPDVKAIVHAHAPAAVAYACMHLTPDPSCARVYGDLLGSIADSRYALPGSLELGGIVQQRFAQGYRTVMMDNHGATVGAGNMSEAIAKYETLDYLCRTLFNARPLGGAKPVQEPVPLTCREYPVKNIQPGDKSVREEMTAFIKRAYAGSLVGCGWGTLAVRDKDGILFNADSDAPDDLIPDYIVRYENGAVSSDKKCKYLDLIIRIFNEMPQAEALFISMPSAAMAFAAANRHFDSRLIPESYIMLKDVTRLPYSAVGDYGQIARALSVSAPAMIIDNECVITAGKNITKAFDRLEVLDYSARSVIMAQAVSDIRPIDGNQVDEINSVFNGW